MLMLPRLLPLLPLPLGLGRVGVSSDDAAGLRR
eukprot:SAG25_NODE_10705_length_325_cov_0.455752_1_plen_32_part_01